MRSIVIRKISLLIFLLYFSITIFFNLPNNYLKANNAKSEAYFQFFFFQRWNFFAPPPTFNERLYYTYKNKGDSSVIILEVFEKLYSDKASKAPFNNKEDILDYILSNSLGSLAEEITEIKQYNFYLLDTKKTAADSNMAVLLRTEAEKSPNFHSLLNYGKLLAETQDIGKKDSVNVTISRLQINRFAERNKKDSVIKEEIFFQSSFFKNK